MTLIDQYGQALRTHSDLYRASVSVLANVRGLHRVRMPRWNFNYLARCDACGEMFEHLSLSRKVCNPCRREERQPDG